MLVVIFNVRDDEIERVVIVSEIQNIVQRS